MQTSSLQHVPEPGLIYTLGVAGSPRVSQTLQGWMEKLNLS